MATAPPDPKSWTLRLKSRKTTVLLHVDPLHTFEHIKSTLLKALQDTSLRDPDTDQDVPLPESSSEIVLGRPVDINDAHQGFQTGQWEYSADEEDVEETKGKGKAKAKAKKTADGAQFAGAANMKNCPKGANLKDGAVLAFRWRGDGIWNGEGDMDIDVKGANAEGEEVDMWGVQLASFEDSYEVDNEADVGGGPEFEE
ncbi:hypothetical protein BDV95DRAFT_626233 [Massariosphaeria phaeospora]|uniref:Uncharacterized protein n=1 Tax=Massariosphaeria phaeospora TaxID=100035 RepID=A0A7C8MDK4_9PLEO|nr:hypothetical protein BDV95DRAFT_626233 [Massariosphaeria phaeospora]